MFPLHLRFAETCYTESWRFYQVFVMFPERKCQVKSEILARLNYRVETMSPIVSFSPKIKCRPQKKRRFMKAYSQANQ